MGVIDPVQAVIERGPTHGPRRSPLGSISAGVREARAESPPALPWHRAGRISGAVRRLGGARRRVVAQVCETEPYVVRCAFGAPKQELWMYRSAAALALALVLGVGAVFDFHAGAKKRAPVWMQRAGLEWLHRLGSEPRRLSWRYLSTNTLFLLTLLRRSL